MYKQLKEYMSEINSLIDSISLFLLDDFKSLMNLELTTKQLIVLKLLQNSQQITVNEIAQALDVTPSAVSQLLRGLQREEYIKRTINPANRRETFVSLHTKGKEFFQEVEQIEEYLADKYYSQLDIEEVHQLYQIISKLHQIIVSEKNKTL